MVMTEKMPQAGAEADAGPGLAALLCTRLCHDLAGPVGAISAGVELLADEPDASFLGEATALLRHSAEASSARLKFLRAAFGEPGRSSLSGPARSLVEGYVRSLAGGIALDWRDEGGAMASAAATAAVGDGAALRLLLNLCLTAADALGGSGGLIVDLPAPPAGGPRRFAVTACGPRAALDAATRAALDGHRGGLTARTAPAYLLHCLARPGGGVVVEETAGRLLLAAAWVRPSGNIVE